MIRIATVSMAVLALAGAGLGLARGVTARLLGAFRGGLPGGLLGGALRGLCIGTAGALLTVSGQPGDQLS